MTYLELVNKLLRRLRESTVTSVSDTDYSLLVGEFVNDAKQAVEGAWPWRSLIDRVTLPLVAGTASYDIEDYNCALSGAPPRTNARLYRDPETSLALCRITTASEEQWIQPTTQSFDFVTKKAQENESYTSKPMYITLGSNPSATSGNSNISVTVYPTPDDSYNLEMWIVNPQNDLSADADVFLVPPFPVLQIAYLYCLYERGEEVGEGLTMTQAKADLALADAIQFDSGNTAEPKFEV